MDQAIIDIVRYIGLPGAIFIIWYFDQKRLQKQMEIIDRYEDLIKKQAEMMDRLSDVIEKNTQAISLFNQNSRLMFDMLLQSTKRGSMAKFEELGKEAEKLFVYNEMNLTQISKVLKVSVNTLSRWKKQYGWEKKRIEKRKNPERILDILEDVLLQKAERMRDKMQQGEDVSEREIREVYKLIESVKKMRSESDMLSLAPLLMKEFAAYLKGQEKYKDIFDLLGDLIPEFLSYLWEKYRGRRR